MKRLKSILLSCDPKTATFSELYNGNIFVVSRGGAFADCDSTYYRENIGFSYSVTHKNAQDRPTVTVMIPCYKLFYDLNGGKQLKRLKYYLLQMEEKTSTYKEMYDGKMEVCFPSTAWDGHAPEPETHHDNVYWHGDVSMSIEPTNKAAQDKPTVVWSIPTEKLGIEAYTKAAADFCLRAFRPHIDALNDELYNRARSDKENGRYYLCEPGGEVLARSTAYFAVHPQKDYVNGSGITVHLLEDGNPRPPKMCLCIRMQVQLPLRRIRKTIQMLCRDLPDAIDTFLANFDIVEFNNALELAEKQAAIREWLKTSAYCAFIANGSILPRLKGTDQPLPDALPFTSTKEDEIELCGVRGMGIKRGVTVITGGGYSGKSTLLDAISAGIYDHVLGDGRELCITDETAVTVSAEDGRSVKNVNISPFIKWLPNGDTRHFSTEHASGSTSQAANIMEAVDAGSRLLLIDEDRSATNFMIQDKICKALIHKEPITPFTDRVKELHSAFNVSTILVIGGSGEFLAVADRIYMMDDYRIHDVTAESKRLCEEYSVGSAPPAVADWEQTRTLLSEGFTSFPNGSGSEKLSVSDMGYIIIGDERIDIRGLHDMITPRQADALGFMLRQLEISNTDRKVDIAKRIDELYNKIGSEGLDCVYSGYFTTCNRFLDLPRRFELMAVISRMRNIVYNG